MNEGKAKPLAREKGSFISHVATLAAGSAVSQVVNVLGIVLLTRFFAPDSFGLLALFMTVVSFLSVLGGARYELAIMLPETDQEAANVFALAVFLVAGISGICLGCIVFLHHQIAALMGDILIEPWLWFIPCVLFLNGLNQIIAFWCGRMKRFHRLAISRIVQAVGTVLAQVVLFYFRLNGGIALIGGWIFGQSIGTLVLVGQTAVQDGSYLHSSWNWKRLATTLKTYRNFPFYKAPYSFISNASSQLVVVVIRLFSSLSTVGLFSMAYRAIYLPVSLITSSMNQVFYEKAATESEADRLESFVNRTLRIQIILAVPFLIFAVVESPLLFSTIFGTSWAQSGAFAGFLSFAGFMYFLTAWLDRLFDVHGRQRLSLAIEVAGNVGSLGALALTLIFIGNPLWAVAAFTVAEVIYSCLWLWCAYLVAGFKTEALWRLAADFVLAAVPVAFVVAVVHLFVHGLAVLVLSAALVLALDVIYFARFVHGECAFESTAERFRNFWLDKTSPMHKNHSLEFYESCVDELRTLFPTVPLPAILEIGCGDGSMFKHLNVQSTHYTGVDFSPKMLEMFRSRHPDLRLLCAEGSSYIDSHACYDLIFSHGVVQHFDWQMLREHLQNARTMMHEDSVLICGSVLDRSHRTRYDSGMPEQPAMSRFIRLTKSCGARILGMDRMGFWYRKEDLARMAEAIGFESKFVQSRIYPYRFHAAFRIQRGRNGSTTLQATRPRHSGYRVFPVVSPNFGLWRIAGRPESIKLALAVERPL